MGLCPIWPLGQRTLPGTGPFSPLVGQRLCAVGAATGALGRCALEKGRSVLFVAKVCFGRARRRFRRAGQDGASCRHITDRSQYCADNKIKTRTQDYENMSDSESNKHPKYTGCHGCSHRGAAQFQPDGGASARHACGLGAPRAAGRHYQHRDWHGFRCWSFYYYA